MGLPPGHEIETVWGRVGPELTEELVAFWSEHGALSPEQGRKRAAEVVCVLRDGDGRIAAVNSVYAGAVETIGGRTFWIYRSFAPGPGRRLGAAEEMIAAARDALAEGFRAAADEDRGPIGLCVIADPELAAERPQATWPLSQLILAGYAADGRQIRIRYFEWWARIL